MASGVMSSCIGICESVMFIYLPRVESNLKHYRSNCIIRGHDGLVEEREDCAR